MKINTTRSMAFFYDNGFIERKGTWRHLPAWLRSMRAFAFICLASDQRRKIKRGDADKGEARDSWVLEEC